MNNDKVAEILAEIGVLLELKGENPFKCRAYASAARTVGTLSESLAQLVQEERLGAVKGLGDALQKKITELVTTGKLVYYDELKNSLPPGVLAMLDVPGVGPKKAKLLYEKLGVQSIDDLAAACENGRVASLAGFGEKTQSAILEGIRWRRSHADKHHLSDALVAALPLLDWLRDHSDVIRCSMAGSLRRSKEVVGDLDFVVSSKEPLRVIDAFAAHPMVGRIIVQGETKASVVLDGGLQADLRVVNDSEYPFALAYFTGSKEHNIVMRQRAIDRGLRLNEYGLFRSVRVEEAPRDPSQRIACSTEEELYQALDLAYIPPELREDLGEFAAAEKGSLPRLVEWTQLHGSLHNHSNWSDGHGSLDEIAAHMENLGCAYWAITDHSVSSFQAHGLDPARLRQQFDAVAAANERLAGEGAGLRLLTGTEVDILNEGRLDFDDDLLAQCDVVVASIHSGFTQSEAELTRRLIRAAENPHVHILGHPTGRLLLERQPYPVDMRAVIDACAATGTWIELNAHPYRLDMDWRLWPYARDRGVRCVINCDAHRFEHAGFLRLGAAVARKGWLTANDVVNTLPLDGLRRALRLKRDARSPVGG